MSTKERLEKYLDLLDKNKNDADQFYIENKHDARFVSLIEERNTFISKLIEYLENN